MPELSVIVNGRSYAIVCGDGQEQHVTALAADIDRRIRQLVAILGQAGEARLLLMAGLLISDELEEAKAQLAEGVPEAAVPAGAAVGDADDGAALAAMGQAFDEIDSLAARIEAVAERLRRL